MRTKNSGSSSSADESKTSTTTNEMQQRLSNLLADLGEVLEHWLRWPCPTAWTSVICPEWFCLMQMPDQWGVQKTPGGVRFFNARITIWSPMCTLHATYSFKPTDEPILASTRLKKQLAALLRMLLSYEARPSLKLDAARYSQMRMYLSSSYLLATGSTTGRQSGTRKKSSTRKQARSKSAAT